MESWGCQKINIWEDPWILRGVTRRPSTVHGQVLIDKVCDLIDPFTGQWDRDLVHQIFNAEDVSHILSISIKEGFDDLQAWHSDPKGIFSGRSAYKLRLLLSKIAAGQPSAFTVAFLTTGADNLLKRIWGLNLPKKISMFL